MNLKGLKSSLLNSKEKEAKKNSIENSNNFNTGEDSFDFSESVNDNIVKSSIDGIFPKLVLGEDSEDEELKKSRLILENGEYNNGGKLIGKVWEKWNMDDIEKNRFLGQGASGTVYKGYNKKTKQVCALKLVNVFENCKRDQIKKELETLTYVPPDHNYIVGFFGAFYKDGTIHLALEYMEGGSLEDIYGIDEKIEESNIAFICFQILQGLKYLHKERRTVHRDLKPANILMNKAGKFKITDFGVSKQQTTWSRCKSFIGTILYMSPERTEGDGKSYSYPSDIWSFGMTILELALKQYPFEKVNSFWSLISSFGGKDPKIPQDKGFSKLFIDFLSKCLKFKPEDRLTATQLLEHEFITKNIFVEDNQREYVRWFKGVIKKVKKKHNNSQSYAEIKDSKIDALGSLNL